MLWVSSESEIFEPKERNEFFFFFLKSKIPLREIPESAIETQKAAIYLLRVSTRNECSRYIKFKAYNNS